LVSIVGTGSEANEKGSTATTKHAALTNNTTSSTVTTSNKYTDYLLKQDLVRKVIFTDTNMKQASNILTLASKSLIPCIYELYSSRNPVYIDTSVKDIDMAAKRVVWASMCNAGQNRYSPNYVLCHQDVISRFLQSCHQWCVNMYGERPEKSKHFGRIITWKNMKTLVRSIEATQEYARTFGMEQHERLNEHEDDDDNVKPYDSKNVRAEWNHGFCEIVCGGKYNKLGLLQHSTIEQRYYSPTILHVSRDVPIMDAEYAYDYDEEDLLANNEGDDEALENAITCGPILSIVTVKDVQDAIEEINGRKSFPLAMYIFSDDFETTRTILSQTRSGGVTINSCIWHAQHPDLTGNIAPWRGRSSIEIFSHTKPILEKTNSRCCGPCLNDKWWIYPPFDGFISIKLFFMNLFSRFNHW
jgi:aldehyde dehydrogenase (NAD+)